MSKPAKFSVKSTMYLSASNRSRQVDGPWKKTPEEAAQAFANMLIMKAWDGKLVYRPFFAEECDEKTAPCHDGKRYYRDRLDLESTLDTSLTARGLRVAPR